MSVIVPGIGDLNVYLLGSTNQTIFNKTGNQGSATWFKGQADLMSVQTFRVLFEGVRGPSFNGDIAVDDISVSSGICSQQGMSTTVAPTPFTTASMSYFHKDLH